MTHDNVAGNFVIGDGLQQGGVIDGPPVIFGNGSPETLYFPQNVTVKHTDVQLTPYGEQLFRDIADASTREKPVDLRRFIADEIARQLPAAIRKVLEDDAKEIATNPAFQSVYVPATGVCWACGKGNGVFQWFTRGGHSHLIHKSEECRRIAETKQEAREQQG